VVERLRGDVTWVEQAGVTATQPPAVGAVLFDRDGTLVVDVPYNHDPALVEPMPTALAAVRALRAAGVPVGVVSNQSGVARGLISPSQLAAVNARVDELFGGFDTWQVCPHGAEDGCACRKPRPGLVLAAAAALGVAPGDVVVVGDIGSDMGAAAGAGARGVLVPTAVTRPDEVREAPQRAATLAEAVAAILAGPSPHHHSTLPDDA
jgi:D-glycero-D-manno-heptose 1,7-bisphosphate phosphatase